MEQKKAHKIIVLVFNLKWKKLFHSFLHFQFICPIFLLELGGNIYYTSKLAANDGINFQNLAGRMTGMGVDSYREMMIKGGRSIEGNREKSEWGED